MDKKTNLVWMDLEMSGLEPETDVIIEIATIITDFNLYPIAEGPVIAIHQPESVIKGMDEWNTKHHGESGLIERVRRSAFSLKDAEIKTLEFVKKYTDVNTNPLCGNSIGQDRRFLYKYMPKLSEHLHYRNLDVSTLKELAARWYPRLPKFEKLEKHQALSDIKESIEELKYYRKTILKDPKKV
ncbi:MAG: oligoribonuclease [Fibrobacterales bacterium]